MEPVDLQHLNAYLRHLHDLEAKAIASPELKSEIRNKQLIFSAHFAHVHEKARMDSDPMLNEVADELDRIIKFFNPSSQP